MKMIAAQPAKNDSPRRTQEIIVFTIATTKIDPQTTLKVTVMTANSLIIDTNLRALLENRWDMLPTTITIRYFTHAISPLLVLINMQKAA